MFVNNRKTIWKLVIIVFSLYFFDLKSDYLSFPNDVRLYDESNNLERGLNLSFGEKLHDGYFYFVFYKFLSLFEKSNIDLYFLMYYCLFSGLIVSIVFGIKIAHNKFAPIAIYLLYFVFFLMSPNIIQMWPFITIFSSLLLSILLLISNNKNAYSLLPLLTFVLVFTRPEFILSFYIILIFALFYIWKHRNQISRKVYLYFIPLIVLLLTLVVLYDPTKGSRSIVAFGQHYSLRLALNGTIVIDPWTNWENILLDHFQEKDSLIKIVTNHPQKFFQHMRDNFEDFLTEVSNILHLGIFPSFVLLLFVYSFSFCLGLYRLVFSRETKYLAVVAWILSLPSLVGVLLIYPRTHYILQLSIPFLYMIYDTFEFLFSKVRLKKIHHVLILSLLVWLSLDKLYFKAKGKEDDTSNPCSNISLASTLNNSRLGKIKFLTTRGPICMYYKGFCEDIREYNKSSPFGAFIKKHDINLVLIDAALIQDTRFVNDLEFRDFLKNNYQIHQYDFKPMKAWNCSDQILLRRSD
ncbi:hypothetical protein [Leptospira ilyithenensis]|uniref:Glycosyltransferase RgtA/B/C/D-like domain-containing protein n=1 Tax=Leptospira ilyithenensis TaxID=2484901 RepID=A0A4R9LU06_9LEPT|nr:hypothetical protein [Leptospira ilyithenensis]TGN14273.1 hypothetical protein EHS11_01995 [Leptospira ilyithenensis]